MAKCGGGGGGCCSFFHNVKFQLSLYSIGFIAGLAALFVFTFVMNFVEAGLMGGVAALYAGALVCDIWRVHRWKDQKILLKLDTLVMYSFKLGWAILGIVISIAGMAYFITMGILRQEKTDGPDYMAAIQAWMVFKWSMAALVHMYRYHSPSAIPLAADSEKMLKDEKVDEEEEEEEEDVQKVFVT